MAKNTVSISTDGYILSYNGAHAGMKSLVIHDYRDMKRIQAFSFDGRQLKNSMILYEDELDKLCISYLVSKGYFIKK